MRKRLWAGKDSVSSGRKRGTGAWRRSRKGKGRSRSKRKTAGNGLEMRETYEK